MTTTSKPLHLLHMDLFGPTKTESRGEKKGMHLSYLMAFQGLHGYYFLLIKMKFYPNL